MRRLYALAALVLSVSAAAVARPVASNENEGPDSVAMAEMNEVVVSGVRPLKNAPFAVAKIEGKDLNTFSKTGQELPFLFARTPGVLAWSENGLGTGTTYMRIRGAADSRINVTIDGVPLNSPEDQCVFWANMNSYGSFLGAAQIQRGVGTSTNGDGAFGGTVTMMTKVPSLDPMLELTGSYGSYNTYNAGLNFSTGLSGLRLPKGYLVLDGAYHHTGTDGYIHGTKGNSGSYYAALTYINEKGNLKIGYKNFGNYEKTGQAWNGVTCGSDNYSMNTYDGISSYKQLYDAGYGRYNSLYEHYGEYYDENYVYHLETGNDGKYTTSRYQMADGGLWPRTTDNFWQNHNLLTAAWQIDQHWSTSATLHYTRGHGYYEEFRYDNKLKKFGLANYTLSTGKTLKRTDFVRQKGLTQDAYGLVWNANYKSSIVDAVAGLSLQQFKGNHYGHLIYVANEELANAILTDGKYTYYDSDATKDDMTAYLKANFHVTSHFDIFADAQYRYVGYYTNGINDKFYANEDGTYTNQKLFINKTYNFFNPKGGLSYHNGAHNAYASVAWSHREPERNNFTDNGAYGAPGAERVLDYEAGYTFNGKNWHAGLNLYYMDYTNQFVQTGRLSDIGENLTTNIKDSYRMGLEISAGVSPLKWLSLEANAALSQNKIKDFTEYVSTYNDWWEDEAPTQIHYDESTLAFSPSIILNGFIDFHHKGFNATWHTGYVGRQYLDNTQCKQRSLDAYTRTDVALNYTLKCFKKGLKETVFGLNFNNIFNQHYASSGWVYSAIVGETYTNDNRYCQIGYIPQAGFTMMGNVTLRF